MYVALSTRGIVGRGIVRAWRRMHAGVAAVVTPVPMALCYSLVVALRSCRSARIRQVWWTVPMARQGTIPRACRADAFRRGFDCRWKARSRQ